jgi:hypothetical protein
MTTRKPIVQIGGALAELPAADTIPDTSIGGSTVGAIPFVGSAGRFAEDGSNLFWDVTNKRLGIGTNTPAQTLDILTVDTEMAFNITTAALFVTRLQSSAGAPTVGYLKGRGTFAATTSALQNDILGSFAYAGYVNSTTAHTGATFTCTLIEPTPTTTAFGTSLKFSLCPLGSGTTKEVLRAEFDTGLSMYGANPVIDQNRAIRLRSTTVSGAITPSVAGNLFYHSDAQAGKGEVAVDTGSGYRHAGQAALKKLTTDADATYTPRVDGRIVRDSATLTANRKLIMSTTNVTDGHKAEVSRRGSSGGKTRDIYQADGTTLIVSVADNASADIIYDATAVLWFQK